jgi:hypothetical protein
VIFLTSCRYALVLALLATGVVLIAGCTSLSGDLNETAVTPVTPGESVPSYVVTLHQPDTRSENIRMDTDLYNIGEVVQFTVTNRGSGTLHCAGYPPSFSVKFQGINGAWITRLGPEKPNATQTSSLEPGKSTQVYAFVTSGWEPGRYRIVHDCGVVREFILRPVPAIATETRIPVNATQTVNATVSP